MISREVPEVGNPAPPVLGGRASANARLASAQCRIHDGDTSSGSSRANRAVMARGEAGGLVRHAALVNTNRRAAQSCPVLP